MKLAPLLARSTALLTTLTAPALANPTVIVEQTTLGINTRTCTHRAPAALQLAGFLGPTQLQLSFHSQTPSGLTAQITCQPLTQDNTRVIIILSGDRPIDPAHTLLTTLSHGMGHSDRLRPPLPAPTSPTLSEADFDRFLGELKANWPDELKFLAVATRGGAFTARQASRIISYFRFSTDQEAAAILLYPSVVDRANWGLVESAFIFNSSRDLVRDLLLR